VIVVYDGDDEIDVDPSQQMSQSSEGTAWNHEGISVDSFRCPALEQCSEAFERNHHVSLQTPNPMRSDFVDVGNATKDLFQLCSVTRAKRNRSGSTRVLPSLGNLLQVSIVSIVRSFRAKLTAIFEVGNVERSNKVLKDRAVE
jgi:hypothetical protein